MAAPALEHTFDDIPGIKRRRKGSGFAYYDPEERLIADPEERRRIAKLAIPPAWTQVWICPSPSGHIQATGRDAKGRKQYIYHPEFRSWREQTKFLHILEFAQALPRLRESVARDLAERKLSRRLVLATAVRILEQTLIRVGNEEYAQQNQSYGLTTLRREHVRPGGNAVRFKFRGKHGKVFETTFQDRRVSAVLRRLEGLPGQQLLQFVDEEGGIHRVTSDDVNSYIREATGGDFSAKDFRTWAATVLAALALLETEAATTQRAVKGNIRRAIERTAQRLGNTPTVCRQSYVHPEVIEGYLDGTLAKVLARKVGEAVEQAAEERTAETREFGAPVEAGLSWEEATVLKFLEKRIRARRKLERQTATLKDALEHSVAA